MSSMSRRLPHSDDDPDDRIDAERDGSDGVALAPLDDREVAEIGQTGGPITWRSVLGVGLVLFVATTVALFLTGNPNLYPTVTLIGSFLVPATFVAFLYEHQHRSTLAFEAMLRAFVAGGVFGILGASILEPALLPRFAGANGPVGTNGGLTTTGGIAVGAIEEACKLFAVILVARRIRHTGALDGLLIGAAVGMGFAALESTGYAFTVLLATHGDLGASILETVIRALFSPFGHGVWTAILGAVVFWQSGPRQFRLTLPVLVAYVFVVLLHGAWDGVTSRAAVSLPFGVVVSWTMAVVGVVGIAVLAIVFRLAVRQQSRLEEAGMLPARVR